MKRLKVSQYVYFTLESRHLTADDIEQRLGISPDHVVVAGSKRREPKQPPAHAWKLVCNQRGLRVDDQIGSVVRRLQPARAAIKELVETKRVTAVLQVVRDLDDEVGGEEEDLTPLPGGFEKLPGQHQLLGWHLDPETIEFLADVRAALDVDEYG